MLGTTEIILIVIVIVLLFGAKRIPELAKALGRAVHEFKDAKDTLKKESEELIDAAEKHADAEDKAASAKGKDKNDGENV